MTKDELAELSGELSTLLARITGSARVGFAANKAKLSQLAGEFISLDPTIRQFSGNQVPDDVFDNGIRHADFMTNVLGLELAEVLITTLPWAYGAYQARGYSYSYFPRFLQHWTDAIQRTLLPESAGQIVNIYGWTQDHHELWIQLSRSACASEAPTPGQGESLRTEFLRLLLAGAGRECIALAENNVKNVAELRSFYSDVIPPVFREIGRLWERGEITVAEEHRASAIAKLVADTLYPLLMPFSKSRGRALVSASLNEFHQLGARLLADLMEVEGWDVDFMGTSVSEHLLLQRIRLEPPDVIAISVAMPSNLGRVKHLIERIRKEPESARMKVIVGGNAFLSGPALWRVVGADAYSLDAQGALTIMEEWWQDRQGQ